MPSPDNKYCDALKAIVSEAVARDALASFTCDGARHNGNVIWSHAHAKLDTDDIRKCCDFDRLYSLSRGNLVEVTLTGEVEGRAFRLRLHCD
jgi:hypothetical protein